MKIKEQQHITLGEVKIDMNPDNLVFSQETLSNYYQRESGYYDFFSAQLAYAEYLLSVRSNDYDKIYHNKFKEYKDLGGSDKYAESKAKADPEVIQSLEDIATAKYKRNLLYQHLRVWDKNHENAMALGHMIRKEMDKLNFEVKQHSSNINHFASEIDIDKLKEEE